jgi:hypothetical protein
MTINVHPGERRIRLLYLSRDLMLRFVLGPRFTPADNTVRALEAQGLPPDVEVQAVAWCDEQDAFMLRLYHPSFDDVGVGYAVPRAEVTLVEHVLPISKDRPRGREFI